MGFKKIQMVPRGFQKMKLRFPSSAVYMENLRESVTNLWFGDKVSKIRDMKIKVGAPKQLHYYTRPKSRRFYGPAFIFRHILGHFDPRTESSPCLYERIRYSNNAPKSFLSVQERMEDTRFGLWTSDLHR